MMLVIISCTTSSTDPYQGLVKKNDTCYLVIEGKMIPVDSGVTYKDAVKAYQYPSELYKVGTRNEKLSWGREVTRDVYVVYDGKKITATVSSDHHASFLLFLIFWTVILFIAVCIIGNMESNQHKEEKP